MKKIFAFMVMIVMMINVVGIKTEATTLEENKIINGYVAITTVRVFEVDEVECNGHYVTLHVVEDHTYEHDVDYIPSGYIFSRVCGYGLCYHNDKEIGDCSKGNRILEVRTYILKK